ncbi:amidohydrolase family protein [Altererythrobacter arenosus]|uniref:Amidohydrolase family protein n=1 Tax=Altererythrobacter arenosus TaxID=3032592 RepID=A0ABY8FUC1_9SPHN|nr:amidohydrolase family protein [Altererythrobacter sp. CAU 1644]WFL76731.1 amidohydrolase family protein [Altererythrobacter sp. CAU 1644]
MIAGKIDRRAVLAGMAAAPLIAASDVVAPFGRGPVTVFEARKIVTMSRSYPNARFMAVADGMVLGLADSIDALGPSWTAGREHRLDRRFADKVIFPGLIDPHIHPMQTAVMLPVPFLAPDDWVLPSGRWPGVSGEDAYRERLSQIVRDTPGDPLIVWGHHELFHGPLGRPELDAISPERPLLVWQRSFHDIYANTAALQWMGLAEEGAFNAALAAAQAQADHGDHARGMFSETALGVAIAKLQPVLLAPDKLQQGFAGLLQMMHARGVTTTSDLATGIFARFDTEAGLIARAFGTEAPTARVNLMPIGAEIDAVDDLDAWLSTAREKFTRDNVLLKRRVKLFADGAFFAQNMRMGAPGYTDGHLGKWLTEPQRLTEQMHRYWTAGFDLHIHVNGDEGAEAVLEGLGKLAPRRGQDIVLEHLGYCTEAQIRRIARMGLMVSAQPNYIRVLGEAYSKRGFGPDRAALMNRLGSLEREGVPLGLHSDFNMAPIDPFYLAWIAQTREGLDGVVRGPEERVSRDKALRAITIEAAQVIGMDGAVGSLAAGKKADFVVLDDDPYEVEIGTMKEMPITATVFEGRI